MTDGSQAKPAGFPSDWAAKEVSAAIAAGIVPQTLQADYTANITRREFCALAMEMLTVRTGKTAETLAAEKGTETAGFTDCGDSQVLAACRLGIVSGVGNGKFAPAGTYTREQAIMTMLRLFEAK